MFWGRSWWFSSVIRAFSFTHSWQWSPKGLLHRGTLPGAGLLPAKPSGEEMLLITTLLPCRAEGNCPSQGPQKTARLPAYSTGARAPAADSPRLNLAFLPTALCKFNGCHFPLQLAKALHFIFLLDACVQLPKLLTCLWFIVSRSTFLTLTLALPPSSPSQSFTIENIARAKWICLWLPCASVKKVLYNKAQ